MTTLAIISDIHGNLPALDAVLADIASRGITAVVNLGDHVSGPLWPRETAARLMQHDWPSIPGNHDRVVVHDDMATLGPSDRFAREQLSDEQLAWLAAMPPTRTMAVAGGESLFLCHGIPTDDRIYLLETPEHGRLRLAAPEQVAKRLGGVRAPVVLCGHSHIARVSQHDGCVIVNPGSVGLPAYTHDGTHAHVSETGSPLARYAMLEWAAADVTPRVTFIAIDYDIDAAARRAEANGRPDWVHALRTGHADRTGRF